MNLLVPDSANSSAYHIIRSLRPYANRIVLALPGKNPYRLAQIHTLYSRYVDKRYIVPPSTHDWMAGVIQSDNTESEEAYIRRIEEVCQREAIDTIYPCHDATVYVLAKNKQRLAEKGILVVGPDYDTVLTPMDKFKSAQAAERAGIAIPRTYVPERVEDLLAIADEIGPPWVIKPRFSLSGKGMRYVTRRENLADAWLETAEKRGFPLVQEFIPGDSRQNFYVISGHDGEFVSFMCPQTLRVGFRVNRNTTTASMVATQTPYREAVATYVRELGWAGTLTIQTKIDARDGNLKFMESNPRPGDGLWRRTAAGIDEPLLCLKLARGETVEPVKSYPEGAVLLDPVSDALRFPYESLDWLVFKIRTRLLGKQPFDPLHPPLPPIELARMYRNNYSPARHKVIEPRSRYFFHDPLACGVWYLVTLKILIAKIPLLGR